MLLNFYLMNKIKLRYKYLFINYNKLNKGNTLFGVIILFNYYILILIQMH